MLQRFGPRLCSRAKLAGGFGETPRRLCRGRAGGVTTELLAFVAPRSPTEKWVWLLTLVACCALLSYGLVWALQAIGRRGKWLPLRFALLRRLAPPVCLLVSSAAAALLVKALGLGDRSPVGVNLSAIFASAWTAMTLINGARHWLNEHLDIHQSDNLRARSIRTQLAFIEKVLDLAVLLSAAAAMLYQFSWGRTLGTSLLASAGVASVIVGLAAQRTLANLIAGFQIAFTQPVRIGDAVVIENEWGWVEEITLTYVVVRIWDLRRLVLPITYLLEKPFQNWTRTSGQILGSVMLTVSHRADFERIERRFNELLDQSERWDRDARGLQVVEWNERSVVLRGLMTAKDSPTCWDLRCEIRRGLLEFIAKQHPEALPVVRLEGSAAAGGAGLLSGVD